MSELYPVGWYRTYIQWPEPAVKQSRKKNAIQKAIDWRGDPDGLECIQNVLKGHLQIYALANVRWE